jgi:hypothetical protein
MPASYVDGEFTSCEGELQDVVGTYTSNGQSEFSNFYVASCFVVASVFMCD